MPTRDSFIFYRSFSEAIRELPESDRLELYEAIHDFSFDFKEPKLKGFSKTIWTLIRPQLEANNKRFMNGKSPKKYKQNGSKTEAKDKQDTSKTEANKNNNVNDNVNNNDNVNDFWNKEFYQFDDYLTNKGLINQTKTKLKLDDKTFTTLFEKFSAKNVIFGLSLSLDDFQEKIRFFHNWIPKNHDEIPLEETKEQKLARKRKQADQFG